MASNDTVTAGPKHLRHWITPEARGSLVNTTNKFWCLQCTVSKVTESNEKSRRETQRWSDL